MTELDESFFSSLGKSETTVPTYYRVMTYNTATVDPRPGRSSIHYAGPSYPKAVLQAIDVSKKRRLVLLEESFIPAGKGLSSDAGHWKVLEAWRNGREIGEDSLSTVWPWNYEEAK